MPGCFVTVSPLHILPVVPSRKAESDHDISGGTLLQKLRHCLEPLNHMPLIGFRGISPRPPFLFFLIDGAAEALESRITGDSALSFFVQVNIFRVCL